MGDLKSIEGGKKKKEDKPLCLYCNMVPFEDHPGLTCPRIASASLTDEWTIYQINFLPPDEWAIFLSVCNQKKEEE